MFTVVQRNSAHRCVNTRPITRFTKTHSQLWDMFKITCLKCPSNFLTGLNSKRYYSSPIETRKRPINLNLVNPNKSHTCGEISSFPPQTNVEKETNITADVPKKRSVYEPFVVSLFQRPSKDEENRPEFKQTLLYPLPTEFMQKYVTAALSARCSEIAKVTPLDYATSLSQKLQNKIYVKREDLQLNFSFKIRGAYNKLRSLDPVSLQKGVTCVSAGNHAQGVALSAQKLNVSAKIFMPTIASAIKVSAVKRMGAEVVLVGDTFDEARQACLECVENEGRILIHPFDDEHTIAGQSTVALEIARQISLSDVNAVIVPCGGGGLLAGIAVLIKSVAPHVKIIGAEGYEAPGMTESLKRKRVYELPRCGTFADGAAVKRIGNLTYDIASKTVDEMFLCTTDEICAALRDVFSDFRVLLEPAGGLAIAAAKKYVRENNLRDRTIVAVTSGANVDFTRLRFVAERADTSEQLIAVRIPERPGETRRLHSYIFPREITALTYTKPSNDAETSRVMCTFRSQSPHDTQDLINTLTQNDYKVHNFTNNDLAKDHIRYMSSGQLRNVEHERLMRFDIPNTPSAMRLFFNAIAESWDITLLHYRCHGSNIAKVLVAVDVLPSMELEFDAFLRDMIRLGFYYTHETNNTAYQEFLQDCRLADHPL